MYTSYTGVDYMPRPCIKRKDSLNMIFFVPRKCVVFIPLFIFMLVGLCPQIGKAQSSLEGWKADWELADGLNMAIDTVGYNLPSHIVFVPNPGHQPSDPLYFVTELKGTIKVITNEREVLTFAEKVLPVPQGPDNFDPVGLTGLCLDPTSGYVFVTFAYLDREQVFRNGMARYSANPQTFRPTTEEPTYFLELFKKERSATSHQIGPCQVKNGELYVAVGYGDEEDQSQNLHSTLGSILRMDLDFNPLADNPFYSSSEETGAINYIWAYGFRNVFGLRFVDGRLFATENGGDVDRFNEIVKGENYLWDGSDWGIGARAAQLFAPAVGLVHLDFIPRENALFPPRFRNKFVTAASGPPGELGRSSVGSRSILMLDFDFQNKHMRNVPEPILNYRGEGMQIPVSVAIGPDGMYFLPLLPNSEGTQAVYRITYDAKTVYPHRIGQDQTPLALINKYKCRQCHIIAESGGRFAPSLDSTLSTRLEAKLADPSYKQMIKELELVGSPGLEQFRVERENIVEATGEHRSRLWLQSYLQNPSFDNPAAQMPQLGVSPQHAEIIADYLLGLRNLGQVNTFTSWDKLRFFIAAQIPELRYRHLLYSAILGALLAALLMASASILARHRK